MTISETHLEKTEQETDSGQQRASESSAQSAQMELEESTYTPESSMRNPRAVAVEIARNLWAGREMSWRMFLRNIKAMYRQTVLGLFWAFLPPLANTAVWAFLHSTKAINLAEGLTVNYIVYVMAGMVVWQSFAEAFQAPLQSVNANRSMLSKIRFPRESVLLVRFFEVLFNLLIRFIVLVPVLLIFGTYFSPWIAFAPLVVLVLILLGFALGLFLMPFGMLYHDVGRMVLIALPIWMIITPIVYLPPTGVFAQVLNWTNPASSLLMVARDLMVFGQTEYWLQAGVYAGITVPLLCLGLVFYHISIPILVERVST